MSEPILILKHGALGDILIATAAFAAIRKAHPDAHITCMTSAGFASLMKTMPYVDEVVVDTKPGPFHLAGILTLRRQLRAHAWTWIYDLQMSGRTHRYMQLVKKPYPNISSNLAWVSHSCADPERPKRHAYVNLQQQMKAAGLTIGLPDVSWMTADISEILESLRRPKAEPRAAGVATAGWQGGASPPSYILLVPGGAPHRPQKRWPAEHYAAIATHYADQGTTPVLLGTKAEIEVLAAIAAREPRTRNLCGKTSIAEIAELARGATFALGNDTGPMHVIAATGCPSTVLFSGDSTPERSQPIGRVTTLQRENLADLSVTDVLASLTANA